MELFWPDWEKEGGPGKAVVQWKDPWFQSSNLQPEAGPPRALTWKYPDWQRKNAFLEKIQSGYWEERFLLKSQIPFL